MTEKAKKNKLKGCLTVLGVVILLMIIAQVLRGNSTSNTDSSSNTVTTSETQKETTATSNKIGDVVTVAKVEYTINNMELVDTVGNEFLNKKANGKFLVLDVTIKNNEDKAITITDDYFILLKGKTEFKSDSTASLYANGNTERNANFFYSKLNPESSITGKVVFDVSEETANDTSLQVQVQTGAWGTQKGIIDLY